MCGIAGFIDRIDETSAGSILNGMLIRLARRGPDGEGQWIRRQSDGWTVALGHRRLSIIDLAGGAQPLGNNDESVEITFNGEVFNYQSLQKRLLEQGHEFRTKSDTEVIVRHYEQHGVDGFPDLNGMFAFGLWDTPRKRLILARDRAGIKPLYYAYLPSGGIVFASELTSLLAYPGINRILDWDAIESYFFSDSIPAPQTAILGVRKLNPGSYLEWSPKIQTRGEKTFWKLDGNLPRLNGSARTSDAALADELWERLRSSVKLQMIADVPVGSFLSGGIDSSIIATLAREIGGEKLQTFSIGFEDKDFDEGPFARLMAERLGTRHTERVLSEQILLDTLDDSLAALDEPLGDPSIIPTFLLSKIASEHVKVALGGDGGDELWAGYPTYKAHRLGDLYGRLPRFLRTGIIQPLVTRMPVNASYQSLEWKAKRFALRWDSDSAKRHLRWMSSTDLPDLKSAFPALPGHPESEKDPWILQHLPDLNSFGDSSNRFLALDFQTYLPGSVLTKVDRASMANSLEVRPPFLDNEFVNWSFSVPFDFKLRNGVSKFLLKRAALDHLPSEIVNRRKKGFAIPLARWLRGPLANRLSSIIESSPLWNSRRISRDVFSAWVERHIQGRQDLSKPLWALIVLDHWVKREGIHVVD